MNVTAIGVDSVASRRRPYMVSSSTIGYVKPGAGERFRRRFRSDGLIRIGQFGYERNEHVIDGPFNSARHLGLYSPKGFCTLDDLG